MTNGAIPPPMNISINMAITSLSSIVKSPSSSSSLNESGSVRRLYASLIRRNFIFASMLMSEFVSERVTESRNRWMGEYISVSNLDHSDFYQGEFSMQAFYMLS